MRKKDRAKIYLLWDFEELCGIFSSFEKARAAARQQVRYMKCSRRADAKRYKWPLHIGKDIEEKVDYGPKLKHMPNTWFFGIDPEDPTTQPCGVEVVEKKLDRYNSLLKRIYSRKRRKR